MKRSRFSEAQIIAILREQEASTKSHLKSANRAFGWPGEIGGKSLV
jgi:hypothetical protein